MGTSRYLDWWAAYRGTKRRSGRKSGKLQGALDRAVILGEAVYRGRSNLDGAAGATYSTPTDALLSPVFLDAVRWVIDEIEGGSKVITDQGGLTRYGISQRAYPGLDIAQLTRAEAEKLYLRDYWRPIRGNALPPAIALVLFDASVNHGPRQAVKLLQAALKVTQDGIMGPETVGAAKSYYPRSELLVRFLYSRDMFYELIGQRPEHASSVYGWKCRLWRLALQAGLWKAL